MKGVRFVVGFLLIAIMVSVVAMLLLYMMVGREPDVPSRATLVLRRRATFLEVRRRWCSAPTS